MRGRSSRIGTRGSALALWQARTVAGLLETTGVTTELVIIRTSGDRLQGAPLSEAGGKRLFVKEIEDALVKGDVDLAVHSAKDMPAVLPEGLDVAATLPREDPRDALVMAADVPAGDFPSLRARLGDAPAIATSSVRRAAQLALLFPGASFIPIRGNVDTRLRKLDGGGYDALVLASAGLRRLGFGNRITAALSVEDCVPAPGQGIVAIEIRADDSATRQVLQAIHDSTSGVSLAAERALVAALGGGCQLPLGAVALHVNGGLDMHAVVATPDGRRALRRRGQGPASDPAALGRRLAEELARDGATDILDAVRGST
ncbi:MAG TPA: hydroxymethylbilane synthase [Vicinamibacterales bacterium]|nr:hydroxymethylbilane synthase [Vicinamibacterales bacterium]